MDEVAMEMPKYKCHKEVWALKIAGIDTDSDKANSENRETDGSAMLRIEDDGYAPVRVDHAYMRKHNPQVGGYYVVYDGGYESFSPADAFMGGYSKV